MVQKKRASTPAPKRVAPKAPVVTPPLQQAKKQVTSVPKRSSKQAQLTDEVGNVVSLQRQ
jgi:hypothetical protein